MRVTSRYTKSPLVWSLACLLAALVAVPLGSSATSSRRRSAAAKGQGRDHRGGRDRAGRCMRSTGLLREAGTRRRDQGRRGRDADRCRCALRRSAVRGGPGRRARDLEVAKRAGQGGCRRCGVRAEGPHDGARGSARRSGSAGPRSRRQAHRGRLHEQHRARRLAALARRAAASHRKTSTSTRCRLRR